MDEFVQLGWAKYLQNGLFDNIWPVKSIGYAVFYKIAHLIGWDATSTILIGRIMTAMLGVGIMIMIYLSTRALKWSRQEALLVSLVLLSYSNFIERIFRTRAEPLAVFFAVASLLILVRGELTARRIFFSGVLTGMAFVTTQKSIYFNLALGLALTLDAMMARGFVLALKRGGFLMLGWICPIVLYVVAFGGIEPIPVLRNLFFGPYVLISDVPQFYTGMGRFIFDTLIKNALLYISCVAGMIIALAHILKIESSERVVLVFSILVCVFIYSHNQPWPYLFVMALPFLSIWVVYTLRSGFLRPSMQKAFLVAIAVGISSSFVRNVHYFSDFGNSHQLAVVRKAESLTNPTDFYFDGVGMLPNRNEPSSLWLDAPLVWRSLKDDKHSELYEIFLRRPPKIIIWNYRMDAVAPVIRDFLDQSYVKVSPNIRLAGTSLEKGVAASFHAPIPAQYQLYSEAGLTLSGQVLLDGTPVALPLALEKGVYQVELIEGPNEALLVPSGNYGEIFDAQGPDVDLFAKRYD